MTAQKIATGIALAALAALFLSVGLPALIPPASVPVVEIQPPVTDTDDSGERDQGATPSPVPPGRIDDDGDDGADRDDDGGDDGGDRDDDDGDDGGDRDDDDGGDDGGDRDDDDGDDSPDGDGDVSPDDDGDDDDG